MSHTVPKSKKRQRILRAISILGDEVTKDNIILYMEWRLRLLKASRTSLVNECGDENNSVRRAVKLNRAINKQAGAIYEFEILLGAIKEIMK